MLLWWLFFCFFFLPLVFSFSIDKLFEKVAPSSTASLDTSNKPTTTSSALTNNLADKSNTLEDYKVCGRSAKRTEDTKTAASTVKDWPWMVSLFYRRSLRHFCGGTLISRRHVLTAAHCFMADKNGSSVTPDDFLVRVGDYDLKRQDESKSSVFSVVHINTSYFAEESFENDIAILTLNNTIKYNSYIQPCCLPTPGSKYDNVMALATGWGMVKYKGPTSNVLMETMLPIWELEKCRPNFGQVIFDTNLCAGGYDGDLDSCTGDSGGPLVMQRKDERWEIIGIVSWGNGCGKKNKPGIYTKVNDYLDWIADVVL